MPSTSSFAPVNRGRKIGTVDMYFTETLNLWLQENCPNEEYGITWIQYGLYDTLAEITFYDREIYLLFVIIFEDEILRRNIRE